MKTLLKATMAALACTVMGVTAHAEGKLAIYHWFEYIPQELLDKFSAQYDWVCRYLLLGGLFGQLDLFVPVSRTLDRVQHGRGVG